MIRKTTDMKNHAIRSPVVMGIAGAILGTVAARLIRGATAAQRKERIEWQPADGAGWAAGAEGGYGNDYEEYRAEAPGMADRARERASGLKERAAELKDDVREKAADLKDRAANMVDDVRDKAVDLKDRAAQRVADVRDRLPSAEELRGRATDAYRFATDEQPVLGGVLAMGVGMALGFLLPVSDREEQIVRPLRDRAADNLGQLDDKVRQLADKLDEKISGSAPQQGLQTTQGSGMQQQNEESNEQNPFVATTSRPFPSA